jgi:hypothetical protein
MKKRIDLPFLCTLLLGQYLLVLLFISLFFFLDLGLLSTVLPLSTVLAILISLKFRSQLSLSEKLFRNTLLVYFFLLIFSVALCLLLFDNSWDGQTYHMQTVLSLSTGWNPFYTLISSDIANAIWVNHYPRGFELLGTSYFALIKNIEVIKISNILVAWASLAIAIHFFSRQVQLTLFVQRLLIATLCLNPISTTQLFSGMVDGQVYNLLVIIVLGFLSAQHTKLLAIPVLSALVILASLKFTGLVYAVLFLGSGLLYRLIKKEISIAAAVRYGVVFIFLTAWVNYSPYGVNIKREQHIFYPLMGSTPVNIMTGTNMPEQFKDQNRFEKFFSSLSARSSNVHGNSVAPPPVLKIPFSLRLSELTVFKASSILYGALGPLFSGVLLISIVLLIGLSFTVQFARVRPIFLLLLFISFTIFLNPECWVSRYVPQLWTIPIIIAIASLSLLSASSILYRIAGFCLLLLSINGLLAGVVNWSANYIISRQIEDEYRWMSKTNQTIYFKENDFCSTKKRMERFGVKAVELSRYDKPPQGAYTVFFPLTTKSEVFIPSSIPPYEPSSFFSILSSYVKRNR